MSPAYDASKDDFASLGLGSDSSPTIHQITVGGPFVTQVNIGVNAQATAKASSVATNSLSLLPLAAAAAPTVTTEGTAGATSNTYGILVKAADGTSAKAGATAALATCNATIDATNRVKIVWAAVSGAASYDVYRTAAGGAPASVGKIGNTVGLLFYDTGLTGDTVVMPTIPSSGALTSAWTAYPASAVGAQVTHANTVTPTGVIQHGTGATVVKTINLPYAGFIGTIYWIPDSAGTWDATGNIAIAGTMVVNRTLTFTYDGTKWAPSYV